jgi:hypothetical protein
MEALRDGAGTHLSASQDGNAIRACADPQMDT